MKEVIVHPERCVGCMQCMAACATAHSRSGNLLSAICEIPIPKSRVHVAPGLYDEGFPNRCRHCDPAPCELACLPGAISRDRRTATVLIDPDRCINCASCAMACPFGVIRYHETCAAPAGKTVAVKCDNCVQRQAQGKIPACVEICKTGALTFEEKSEALRRRTKEMAMRVSIGADQREIPGAEGFVLLNALKRSRKEVGASEL